MTKVFNFIILFFAVFYTQQSFSHEKIESNEKIKKELSYYDKFYLIKDIEKPIYQNILNNTPLLENNDKETLRSYNYFTFSNNGAIFNHKMLHFIDDFFSPINYRIEQLPLLYNTNDKIYGEVIRIQDEINPIRKKIETEELFSNIKHLRNKNYIKDITQYTFYNTVEIDHMSDYNYQNKELKIAFSTQPNSINTSLFCNPDISVGYIYGNSESEYSNIIYRINKNHPILINLPENIKNQFSRNKKNQCIFTKKFKSHEDAIEYYDILNNPKSRFIIHFNINKEQKNNTLYYSAEASKFGLYEDYYGLSKEVDVFVGEVTNHNSIPDQVMKIVKDINKFSYGDSFYIKNFLRNDRYYQVSNFFINIDEEKKIGRIKNNFLDVSYKLEKIDHYYKMTIDKIYNINSLNIPRTIYIRKVYGNIDAFIDYTYNFEANMFTISQKPTDKFY